MGSVGQVGYPTNIADFHSELMQGAPDASSAAAPSLNADYQTEFNRLEVIWKSGGTYTGGPYDSLTPYDPSSDPSWAAMSTRQTALNTVVDGITVTKTSSSLTVTPGITVDFEVGHDVDPDDIDDADTVINNAIGFADEVVPDDDIEVSGQVAAFRKRRRVDLGRAYNRLMGGLSDINAVVSTAAPTAFALLESEHAAAIDEYDKTLRTEVRLRNKAIKAEFISRVAGNMADIMRVKTDRYNAKVSEGQVRISAKDLKLRSDAIELDKEVRALDVDTRYEALSNERLRTQVQGTTAGVSTQVQVANLIVEGNHRESVQLVQWDVDDVLWGFGLLGAVSGALDPIKGIPTVPPKPTVFQTVLGTLGTIGGVGTQVAGMFL